MLKSIHHVAVICADFERSRYFYTEILGLRVVAQTYRAERRSYKLDLALPDGGQVELFSFPDPPKRSSRPEACGLRHLAFVVEDLEAAIQKIKAFDVPVQAIRLDDLTGCRFVFLEDPDGLPIELYEVIPCSD
jgi:glyoxylase I family protein